jgi:hypothetical protein
MPSHEYELLVAATAQQRAALQTHSLYGRLVDLEQLRWFMESHVYVVWDFMCLLKSLQRFATCAEVAWRPVGDPAVRRVVNELVLAEESDAFDGRVLSRLEAYLEMMDEIGADTGPMQRMLERLRGGVPIGLALGQEVPRRARMFIQTTLGIIGRAQPHEIAGAVAVGRELAIAPVFRQLVKTIERRGVSAARLRAYLDQRSTLDGGVREPAAARLLESFCGDDRQRWQEAGMAAADCLDARAMLWSRIEDAVTAQSPMRTG